MNLKIAAVENGKLLAAKNKAEMACRELQKNSVQILETNKQIVEESKKNRDEITTNFEKHLETIKQNEVETKDFDEQNEKFPNILNN